MLGFSAVFDVALNLLWQGMLLNFNSLSIYVHKNANAGLLHIDFYRVRMEMLHKYFKVKRDQNFFGQ